MRLFERLVSATGNVPGWFVVLATARLERRSMFASLFSRSWLALVVVSGCFSEAGALDDGGGETTAAQMCDAGGLGCACYGNASCDAGLACVAALDVCVPADCEPGSLQCVCDDDGCGGVLACIGGVCVEMMPSTASGGPSGDPSGDPSDGTQAADVSSSAGSSGDATSAESEGSSSSGSAEGESTGDTGTTACGELECNECPLCAAEPAGDCGALSAACDDLPGCEAAAACLMNCGVSGICFDDCCADASPAAASAAMALDTCRADQCTLTCGEYHSGQCSG